MVAALLIDARTCAEATRLLNFHNAEDTVLAVVLSDGRTSAETTATISRTHLGSSAPVQEPACEASIAVAQAASEIQLVAMRWPSDHRRR